jgi:hypothetical protein
MRKIFTLQLLLLFSCNSEDDPNLLVTVKHNGYTVGQASVYVTTGKGLDPNLPIDQYELAQRGDGSGDAYFTGLKEGEYTVFVSGYDSRDNNKKVEGRKEFTISTSTRNNTFKITVDTQ